MTVYANIGFNPAIWIDLPAVWDDVAPEPLSWGRHFARSCWIDSALPHDQEHLDYLAEVLTSLATRFGPDSIHPEHEIDPSMEIQTLLYLPDPRILPFPLRVMVMHEELVRNETLTIRDLVAADDPEAIEAPEVVEFEHPNLGVGLRAFRHRASVSDTDRSTGVFAVLKYAFPIPGHDDLLLASLAWPDLARVNEALDDIDDLIRSITVEYHPEPEAEAGV